MQAVLIQRSFRSCANIVGNADQRRGLNDAGNTRGVNAPPSLRWESDGQLVLQNDARGPEETRLMFVLIFLLAGTSTNVINLLGIALVALWNSYNRHLSHIISVVPEDKLRNMCFIGENAPVTLEFLITDYLRHLKHHLDQIMGGW